MLMYLVYWLVGSYIAGTAMMLMGTYGFKDIKDLDKKLHYRLHALLWLLSPVMGPLALVAAITKLVNKWASNLVEVVAMLPVKLSEKDVDRFTQKEEAIKTTELKDFSQNVAVIKSVEDLQKFLKEMQDVDMFDDKPTKEDVRH